jgi:predicted RND superfamily exporter protein
MEALTGVPAVLADLAADFLTGLVLVVFLVVVLVVVVLVIVVLICDTSTHTFLQPYSAFVTR